MPPTSSHNSLPAHLHPLDALCIVDNEELAMNIANWLYTACRGWGCRFPQDKGERPARVTIVDATDIPALGGYAIFWTPIINHTCWINFLTLRRRLDRQFRFNSLTMPPIPTPGGPQS